MKIKVITSYKPGTWDKYADRCVQSVLDNWPVANHDLTKIESPVMTDRIQWLNDLGYKLWSTEEIRNGTVFKRFKFKLGF
jgi:hypothetical protein